MAQIKTQLPQVFRDPLLPFGSSQMHFAPHRSTGDRQQAKPPESSSGKPANSGRYMGTLHPTSPLDQSLQKLVSQDLGLPKRQLSSVGNASAGLPGEGLVSGYEEVQTDSLPSSQKGVKPGSLWLKQHVSDGPSCGLVSGNTPGTPSSFS